MTRVLLSPEVLVVLALATYRVARIIAEDTISEPARERMYRWAWDDAHPDESVDDDGKRVLLAHPRAAWRTWVHGLFTCPLCIGVWTAAALYALWRFVDWEPVNVAIVMLAIAGLQCFLATRADA